MSDLFDYAERYPHRPGWKARDTAKAAAASESHRAPVLRDRCLAELRRFGPMTADECAKRIDVDRLSIRPRFSELATTGKIRDTGGRRRNESRKPAIVWTAT